MRVCVCVHAYDDPTSWGLFQCLSEKTKCAVPSITIRAPSTRAWLTSRVTAISQDRAWEDAVVRLYQTTRAKSEPACVWREAYACDVSGVVSVAG